VISTRDVVFNKETVFNSKIKDLKDNLMHNILEEIAILIRTIKLLTLSNSTEVKALYKDKIIADIINLQIKVDPPGYY
jgi:hypothetical protein